MFIQWRIDLPTLSEHTTDATVASSGVNYAVSASSLRAVSVLAERFRSLLMAAAAERAGKWQSRPVAQEAAAVCQWRRKVEEQPAVPRGCCIRLSDYLLY